MPYTPKQIRKISTLHDRWMRTYVDALVSEIDHALFKGANEITLKGFTTFGIPDEYRRDDKLVRFVLEIFSETWNVERISRTPGQVDFLKFTPRTN